MGNIVSAALTDSVLNAEPVPHVGVAWAPSVEVLRFFLGGRELGAIRLRALTLTTPFTHLSTELAEAAPSIAFPPGVEAFVVPAQPIAANPPRLKLLPGMIRYTGQQTERYSINLDGIFTEYMKKFSAKSRYNLTRAVRKFAEFSGGWINLRDFTSREKMKQFYGFADEISHHSWGARIGRAGFNNRMPETELLTLAQEGAARGFVLFHGERPIAYVFCRAHGRHLLYEYIAYDENYAKWSPGSVLLYLIIERLFAEKRYQRLDLGEGTLGYKSFFATDSTRCVRLIYFRHSVRNLALTSTHLGLCSASVATGGLLRVLGMKQKLKRLMMGKTRRPGQES